MRVKADGVFVRRQNRLLLLETLRRLGPLARIELGRETGLSPATVTSITGDMVAEGLLIAHESAPDGRPGPGRPLQRLQLGPHAASVLAIEISVDTANFYLTGYDGATIAHFTWPDRAWRGAQRGYGAKLVQAVRHFLKRHAAQAGPLQRIGISVQGIADARLGTIAWSPSFPAGNVAIVEPLEKAFGVEAIISNDANLAARSLMERQPRAFAGSAAIVFIGNGVGMGLIIGGSVYAGPGGAAAEFGHMNHVPGGPLCRCGRRGCIEAYVADYGILRRAEAKAPASAPHNGAVPRAKMERIAADARAGKPDAAAAFGEAGLAVGYGLARSIALLELERVAFVGTGAAVFDLLEPAIRHGLKAGLPEGLWRDIPIEVEPSERNLIVLGLIGQLVGEVDRQFAARAVATGELMLG